MAKKNLHPNWYLTKVYCDGQLVLEVGGTKKELTVEVWSGNHPFFKTLSTSQNLKKKSENTNYKVSD